VVENSVLVKTAVVNWAVSNLGSEWFGQ